MTLFTLILCGAIPAADSASTADFAAMQGRWVLMSWQDDGYDATFGGKGPAVITVQDRLFRYERLDGSRLHDDELILLDSSKDPKRFALLREKQAHPLFKDPEGRPLPYRGAYRLDGDELRIGLNLKTAKSISLALDNSRPRPGTKRGHQIDGFEEESDKLYVLMREEGYVDGASATNTGLTPGNYGRTKRPLWAAEKDGGSLSASANWQRLRFWFSSTEPDALEVNLGGGKVLRLGAVAPDKVKSPTQTRADLFRYPAATVGDETAHGHDVPYRGKIEGPDNKVVEPFWFSVDLHRKGGELRIWMTGQTVMTTGGGSGPSPVKIGLKTGTKLCELRWLEAEPPR